MNQLIFTLDVEFDKKKRGKMLDRMTPLVRVSMPAPEHNILDDKMVLRGRRIDGDEINAIILASNKKLISLKTTPSFMEWFDQSQLVSDDQPKPTLPKPTLPKPNLEKILGYDHNGSGAYNLGSKE